MSYLKVSELKEGMKIGWLEGGWNECVGIMITNEIIKAKSVLLGGDFSMSMVRPDVNYYKIKYGFDDVVL